MRSRIDISVFLLLLFILFLFSILGVSPRIHQVDIEMRNARLAVSSGEFIIASQRIANAAGHLPWRIDLWERAGRYSLQGDDPQMAILYLERALEMSQENGFSMQYEISSQGLMDLGDAYQQIGDAGTAIQTWQLLVSREGYSKELIENLVQAYVSLGDYTSAISLLQGVVALEPKDAQFQYRLGLFTATQNPEESLDSLDKALQLDRTLEMKVSDLRRAILSARYAQDLAFSLLVTGRALASIDEWQLAAEAFRQATLLRPSYAEAWAYLGEAYQTLNYQMNTPVSYNKNNNDGLNELEKALELDPNSLSAHLFLSLYWKRHMEFDLALDLIRSAISKIPSNPILQVELANLLAASGDLDSANDAYLRAISLRPYDPIYKKYLIEFSLEYDYQVEEIALPVARQLTIGSAHEPAALDLMAEVLIHQGDLSTAERFLRRALEEDINYASAHLHLGLVYIMLEKFQNAYEELTLVVSLAPDSDIANQAQRLLVTYFP